MLIQSYSGMNGYAGYGLGAGLGAFTQGVDFNCTGTICFAKGAGNDSIFKSLQQKINLFAGIVGFKTLTVDGFIGANTVAAFKAIDAKVGLPGLTNVASTTKEIIATKAPELVEVLNSRAQALANQGQRLSPPGTPVTVTPPTVATTSVVTPATASVIPTGGKKSTLLFAIAGGAAALLVVGGVGYALHKRRRATTF